MTEALGVSPVPEWMKEKRIAVMLGAGGVGKTTTSIALALAAATAGRRVALLSIDPAKRLASALGIPLGNQLRRIEVPGISGAVDAAMLDQKAVFDSMVRRHAPSDVIAEKILAHPVYRAASTNLSGPLEYMALAKLQELAEDHRYDLIVLDTPPDTHALDFLARPNVLAGFMENKVMSWLIRPFLMASRFGLGRLLSAGEKLMGGIAKVTGVTALHSFAEFLVLMQEVIEGFNQTGEKILALLKRPDTGFMLVTAPTRAAARSAANIAAELHGMSYRCDLLLFNRTVPDRIVQDLACRASHGAADPALAALSARVAGEQVVIRDLQRQLDAAGRAPTAMTLADQEQDLGSLPALLVLAAALAGARTVS